MEINGQIDRLDLDDVLARRARDAVVRLVISSDAHSVRQLDHVRYGTGTARRGGLTAAEVVNCWPARRLRAFLRGGA